MLVTRQPIFRRFWHAVMPLAELANGPKLCTLLGERIVLFLDADGAPAAQRAVDLRRRGIEFSMDSDRPGILIRKQLMELLAAHGEAEVF